MYIYTKKLFFRFSWIILYHYYFFVALVDERDKSIQSKYLQVLIPRNEATLRQQQKGVGNELFSLCLATAGCGVVLVPLL